MDIPEKIIIRLFFGQAINKIQSETRKKFIISKNLLYYRIVF